MDALTNVGMNLFQMVNYFLSFLLIIVKNNKTGLPWWHSG